MERGRLSDSFAELRMPNLFIPAIRSAYFQADSLDLECESHGGCYAAGIECHPLGARAIHQWDIAELVKAVGSSGLDCR
jgi:hypothetical protein